MIPFLPCTRPDSTAPDGLLDPLEPVRGRLSGAKDEGRDSVGGKAHLHEPVRFVTQQAEPTSDGLQATNDGFQASNLLAMTGGVCDLL